MAKTAELKLAENELAMQQYDEALAEFELLAQDSGHISAEMHQAVQELLKAQEAVMGKALEQSIHEQLELKLQLLRKKPLELKVWPHSRWN